LLKPQYVPYIILRKLTFGERTHSRITGSYFVIIYISEVTCI